MSLIDPRSWLAITFAASVAWACGSSSDTQSSGGGGQCDAGACGGGSGTATCGNGIVEAGEDCDRTLNGATCASATSNSQQYGTLGCTTTCKFDLANCSSTNPTQGSGGSVGSGGSGSGGSGGTVGIGGTTGVAGATSGCASISCNRNATCLNMGCLQCTAAGYCQ